MNDTDPSLRKVTLPTRRLIAVAWAAAIVAGLVVAGVIAAIGPAAGAPVNGAAAAGIVGVVATLAVIALMPWRPRALLQWPVVWLAASFVRLMATMGGTYLLYSATHFGGKSLWLAVLVVYLAAMVGETRVYATSMRRFAPGGAEASTPE